MGARSYEPWINYPLPTTSLAGRSPLALSLAGHHFFVARSHFSASLDVNGDEPGWGLEVWAEERIIDGMEWSPSVGDHFLQEPWPGLDRLPGTTFEIPGPPDVPYRDPAFEEPAFLLYQWDHMPVRDVTIRFGDRMGDGFAFHFEGSVDLMEDRFPSLTRFTVDGVLPLDGLLVFSRDGALDPAVAEDRLATHFDRRRFGAPTVLGGRSSFFPYG